MRGYGLTKHTIQLRVQSSGIIGFRTQIPQSVLGDIAGDSLLNRVGALDADEETIARHDGTGSFPNDQSAAWADVRELDVGGSIRFWGGTESKPYWRLFPQIHFLNLEEKKINPPQNITYWYTSLPLVARFPHPR